MEMVSTDFDNWGSYVMKQFQSMFEKGERCDLEITCHEQIFLVHRLIMAACSDYVRELSDKQHIILPEEVSCKTLRTVIDFVYSGKIAFLKEDKEDLLIAASLLNIRLLIELIEREDPSSYTISMDDDGEYCESESINTAGINTSIKDSEDILDRRQPHNYGKTASKRKLDAKPMRNKSPRKNFVVLPPLHQFPYLQQKLSGSRTYGLITNLTRPVPSRFEISDADLEASSCGSYFQDITYHTKKLYTNSESLRLLEECHIQFLEKLKNAAQRRNHINTLFSPFDKYIPPCGLKKTDSPNFLKSESVVSYPSKIDAMFNTCKYQVNNVSYPNNLSSQPSASTSTTLISSSLPVKEYKRLDATRSALLNNSPKEMVEEKVHSLNDVNVCEMNVQHAYTINDEPVMPLTTLQKDAVLTETNGSVESAVSQDKTNSSFLTQKEDTDTPLSTAQCINPEVDKISEKNLVSTMKETMNVKERQHFCQLPNAQNEIEMLPNSGSEPNVSLVSCDINENDSLGHTPFKEEVDIKENSLHPKKILSSALSTVVNKTSTPLSANSNNSQITTDLSSRLFAVKVKGAENTTQMKKLVDLYKNNSLFIDKSLCFKIVPVKGNLTGKLKETITKSSLRKAIIVKQTKNISNDATDSLNKPTSTVSKLFKRPKDTVSKFLEKSEEASALTGAIHVVKTNVTIGTENIDGPWTCENCGPEPLIFSSYYNYRIHLHTIHQEFNNPIYCIHCGYKSSKRNMQLYHLFVEHNVTPPPYVKFPKCNKCEFYALNEHYLQKHSTCHPSVGMEYVCSCKVAFKSSNLLQKHMVSGDCKNSKSFTCGYCCCTFDRFVNLKAHMRICMKERSKPMRENDSYSEFDPLKTN